MDLNKQFQDLNWDDLTIYSSYQSIFEVSEF